MQDTDVVSALRSSSTNQSLFAVSMRTEMRRPVVSGTLETLVERVDLAATITPIVSGIFPRENSGGRYGILSRRISFRGGWIFHIFHPLARCLGLAESGRGSGERESLHGIPGTPSSDMLPYNQTSIQ